MNSGSLLWEAALIAVLLELQVHRSYLHCSGTGLIQNAVGEGGLEILFSGSADPQSSLSSQGVEFPVYRCVSTYLPSLWLRCA